MKKKIILGLTETITVFGEKSKETVIARIDTGATSSSIDYNLAATLKLGPITKSKTIKSASGVLKRPIIHAKVKIYEQVIEAEFSLADRSHLKYVILIGQNILKQGNFLIDPNKEAKE